MTVRKKPSGKWEVRVVLPTGRRIGRTFDRKSDAQDYNLWLRRRTQLGEAVAPERDAFERSAMGRLAHVAGRCWVSSLSPTCPAGGRRG
jgi:hypothetical protein